MSDSDLLPIGQRVYTGPQPQAPILKAETATEPAEYGEQPPRPTGTVRGVQALDPNEVSYLVVKDEGGNEWFNACFIEVITE